MPTISKLMFAAVLKGLPFLIIIVSSGIYAARHKSIAGGLIAFGGMAIAIQTIWSVFVPVWLRTHTPEEYGRIMLPMSICGLAGWYLVSTALAVMLMRTGRTSDNN